MFAWQSLRFVAFVSTFGSMFSKPIISMYVTMSSFFAGPRHRSRGRYVHPPDAHSRAVILLQSRFGVVGACEGEHQLHGVVLAEKGRCCCGAVPWYESAPN
jgi:hypothetical protein